MTIRKMRPEQELVVAQTRTGGHIEAFLCDSRKEAFRKYEDLRKRGLIVTRRGSVRNILGD